MAEPFGNAEGIRHIGRGSQFRVHGSGLENDEHRPA